MLSLFIFGSTTHTARHRSECSSVKLCVRIPGLSSLQGGPYASPPSEGATPWSPGTQSGTQSVRADSSPEGGRVLVLPCSLGRKQAQDVGCGRLRFPETPSAPLTLEWHLCVRVGVSACLRARQRGKHELQPGCPRCRPSNCLNAPAPIRSPDARRALGAGQRAQQTI